MTRSVRIMTPLYATPFLTFAHQPIYPQEDLDVLTAEHADHPIVDRCAKDLGDESVIAEIHHFRTLTQEGDRIEARIIELEKAFGDVQALKLGSIRRMEMVDMMARLEERRTSMLDYRELWPKVVCGRPT